MWFVICMCICVVLFIFSLIFLPVGAMGFFFALITHDKDEAKTSGSILLVGALFMYMSVMFFRHPQFFPSTFDR